MSRFIGYPNRQVLGVFDSDASTDRAVAALSAAGVPTTDIQRFSGPDDAERFDGTGEHHGLGARIRRIVQFSLMDQLPAMAWYEAALRQGRSVVAVHTTTGVATKRAVEAMKSSGGHFINRFGRVATEEFARWQGPEPPVADLMKH